MTWSAEDGEITIPAWVRDLDSFRRWTDEPTFPETGKFGGYVERCGRT